jgi:hypothetical protein
MEMLFKDCGLDNVEQEEGDLLPFPIHDIEEARQSVLEQDMPLLQSKHCLHVVFDAIFNRVEKNPDFAEYYFTKFDLFHFRPHEGFVEKEGGAKYDIFQLPLPGSEKQEHVYIVVDCIRSLHLGITVTLEGGYRLRGVSKSLSDLVPTYAWCNEPTSWIYWSDAPTDFNR